MILWVDDESPMILKPFIEELEDENYQIVMARSPDEMWRILSSCINQINCIIMDIMMPTGNSVDPNKSRMGLTTGLVLMQELRQHELYMSIPIIIFTIVNESEVFEWAENNSISILKKQDTLPNELLQQLLDMGVPAQ